MTDAPERIYATGEFAEGLSHKPRYGYGQREHVRADLHQAALQAAYAEGLEAAAASIKEPIAQIVYDGWYKKDWPVTSHGYQKVREACDAAIRALPNKYEVKW